MHLSGGITRAITQAVSLRDMAEHPGIEGFASPVLSIERDQDVATLWLDRPEARNAMGVDLWRDLPRAMAAVTDDNSVRVVVIAAKGPHFSVGLDLKAMGNLLTGGGYRAGYAGGVGYGGAAAGGYRYNYGYAGGVAVGGARYGYIR